MAFIGNTPTTQAFTPAVDYFSGNGSTTSFTLSRPVASVAQVQVTIDNVAQNPSSAYTVSSNTITFTSAPLSGTNNIYVYYTSPITQVIAPGQGTVTTTSLATGFTLPVASGGTGGTTSTGSGAVVLATSPTLVTPALGTPSALVLTNATGLPVSSLPAGSIIQVASATLSGSFTTGSTTPNASGLTVTITPQFSNSKIFITSCLGWTHKGGGSAVAPLAYHYVYRQINGGGYSNLQLITIQGNMSNGSNGGDVFGGSIAYSYVDSPATTTAVNYAIYMASSVSGTNIYMGENNAACNIIAMEIKQ